MPKKTKAPVRPPKEINLRQFWNIDVIIEYQPEFQRLVIKKPSGQDYVGIWPRDVRK